MAKPSRNGIRNSNINMNQYTRPEYQGVCPSSPNGLMDTRFDGFLCNMANQNNGQICGGDMLWCYSMIQVRNTTNLLTATCSVCHLVRAGLDAGFYFFIFFHFKKKIFKKIYNYKRFGM